MWGAPHLVELEGPQRVLAQHAAREGGVVSPSDHVEWIDMAKLDMGSVYIKMCI